MVGPVLAEPEVCSPQRCVSHAVMIRFPFLLLAALLALPLRAQAFDLSGVDPATVRFLAEHGELIVVEEHPNGRLRMVTAGVVIPLPPDRIWDVITDYDAYPEWVPEMEETRVINQTDRHVDVAFRLVIFAAVVSKSVDYTLRIIENPKRSTRWFLLDGDFAAARGSWQLLPLDEGTSTLAFYSTYTDMASLGWVVETLLEARPDMEYAMQTSAAVMMVKSLKGRLADPAVSGPNGD